MVCVGFDTRKADSLPRQGRRSRARTGIPCARQVRPLLNLRQERNSRKRLTLRRQEKLREKSVGTAVELSGRRCSARMRPVTRAGNSQFIAQRMKRMLYPAQIAKTAERLKAAVRADVAREEVRSWRRS